MFRAREKVTLIGYADEVRRPQAITVPAEQPQAGSGPDPLRGRAGSMPTGNTATYTALREAYRVADRQVRDNPDALTSIVLMTDGEQNVGISEADVPPVLPRAADRRPRRCRPSR